MDRPPKPPIVWLFAGIFITPLFVNTVYLILSRWPVRRFTVASDWTFFVLSIAVGVFCVTRCPLPVISRVAWSLLYTLFAGWFLLFYNLIFVCMVFKDCL